MTDNWDDDEDDWDADDDEIDKKLGLAKTEPLNDFDEEEDLALKEKREADAAALAENKKKGTALLAKKRAEADKQEELELARRAMELEAEAEANMTPDELRAFKRMQIEEADNALTDDLFGGVEAVKSKGAAAASAAGDKLVLKDLPSHLKHARKVASAMRVSQLLRPADSLSIDWQSSQSGFSALLRNSGLNSAWFILNIIYAHLLFARFTINFSGSR